MKKFCFLFFITFLFSSCIFYRDPNLWKTDTGDSYKKIIYKNGKPYTVAYNMNSYSVNSDYIRAADKENINLSNLIDKNDGIIRLDAHLELPEELKNFSKNYRSANPNAVKNVVKIENEYQKGDKRYFWISNSKTGEQVKKRATLKEVGKYCYVWVIDGDIRIKTTDIEDIAYTFDEVVYPHLTNLCGEKYDIGNWKDGFINPHDRISILIYDIDDDYSQDQESGVAGFFYSLDFYTQETVDAANLKSKKKNYSNEDEIFYIDSGFLLKNPNTIFSTLAHEFNHMLNFIHNDLELPETWYTEMLSMSIEDILQRNLDTSDSDGPKRALNVFNGYYYYGFVDPWGSTYDTAFAYANTYAFGAFLLRNFGGAKIISDIAKNSETGFDSILSALRKNGYKKNGENYTKNSLIETFSEVLINYGNTDKNLASLNRAPDSVVEGYTYRLEKIDLGKYSIELGGRKITGPVSFDYADIGSYSFLVLNSSN